MRPHRPDGTFPHFSGSSHCFRNLASSLSGLDTFCSLSLGQLPSVFIAATFVGNGIPRAAERASDSNLSRLTGVIFRPEFQLRWEVRCREARVNKVKAQRMLMKSLP